MRLTEQQVDIIKSEILKYDSKAEIYLFGSRVDDGAKGGDIDLLVLSKEISFEHKIKILAQFMIKMGEQKIDLVIAADESKPFTQIALDEGILL